MCCVDFAILHHMSEPFMGVGPRQSKEAQSECNAFCGDRPAAWLIQATLSSPLPIPFFHPFFSSTFFVLFSSIFLIHFFHHPATRLIQATLSSPLPIHLFTNKRHDQLRQLCLCQLQLFLKLIFSQHVFSISLLPMCACSVAKQKGNASKTALCLTNILSISEVSSLRTY